MLDTSPSNKARGRFGGYTSPNINSTRNTNPMNPSMFGGRARPQTTGIMAPNPMMPQQVPTNSWRDNARFLRAPNQPRPQQVPPVTMPAPRMPFGIETGPGYTDPNQANIPDITQGTMSDIGGARGMGGLWNAYRGAGPSLSTQSFRNRLFY